MNEGQSIAEAGLSDGASLSLELASAPLDDRFTLRFSIVSGNDIQPKHNPNQAGTRGIEYLIEVSGTDSISVVKEQMLALAHSGPGTLSLSLELYRLRATNWAGECGDIVDEFSEENKEITLGSVIKHGSLRASDLILVEEGRCPIKGMLHIKV